MDPITATFLMINGALLAGNSLLWYTDPSKSKRAKPQKPSIAANDPIITIKEPESFATGSPAQLIARVADAKVEEPIKEPEPIFEPSPIPDELEAKRVERRLTAVTTRINTVETMLTEKLDQIETRLAENREHIDNIKGTENAELIEKRIEELENTVKELEEKTKVDPKKIDKLEKETVKLKKEIASLKQGPKKKKEEDEIEDLDKSIKALKSKLKR
ncbi:MAG: hypothetical protein JXA43_03480 [Candidatus Diapherotrites archaeon]|nr:hypothetical protein [Candidatus Diapherotrites archaeon]